MSKSLMFHLCYDEPVSYTHLDVYKRQQLQQTFNMTDTSEPLLDSYNGGLLYIGSWVNCLDISLLAGTASMNVWR